MSDSAPVKAWNESELRQIAETAMKPDQWAAWYLVKIEEMPVVKVAQAFRITRQAVDARVAGGQLRLVKALEALEREAA